MRRSGAVMPAVVMVMVLDVWVERILKHEDETISSILAHYDEYFAGMQDETNPGGVAFVRATLETSRKSKRSGLLKMLGGNSAAPSIAGTYHFYSAALTETRHRRETTTGGRCNRRECTESERTVNVPYVHYVKTFHHTWTVTEAPRPGQPELSVIKIEEKVTEVPGLAGSPVEEAHDLGPVDAGFDVGRELLRKEVALFNLREEALGLLFDQEMVVAQARSLIASWDNESAAALARQSELLSNRNIAGYRRTLDDYERGLIVAATRAGIVDAQKSGKASIASVEKGYPDAVEQARKSGWQRELGQILAAAQFGLQAYQTVNLVLAKVDPPANRIAEPTETPSIGEKKSTPSEPKVSSTEKQFEVKIERNAAARSFANSAQLAIERAEKTAASPYKNGLPRDRPTREEALYQQALVQLDRADKAAVAFGKGNPVAGKSDVARFRDTANLAQQGKWFDAFLSSVASSTTSDQDMLGGLHHRNELRRRALEGLSGFN